VQELASTLANKLRDAYWSDTWFHEESNREALTLKEGLWYLEEQIVVPHRQDIKQEILKELHSHPSAGHRGIDRTLEKI
jgi:hypothetical protein